MSRSSRISSLSSVPIAERWRAIAEVSGVSVEEVARALDDGGLRSEDADKLIENVVGTYALPFAVALNVRVNDREYVVPMAIEEPSVVAAASNAARIVRDSGGFQADADESIMAAQVQLSGIADAREASARLQRETQALLADAERAVPSLREHGGGAKELEVRDLGEGWLVVHLIADVRDAMGANMLNTMAEAVGPTIARITEGSLGLRILTNLADRRRVRVRANVALESLALEGFSGEAVAHGVSMASQFADRDPFRAATHNKGIMNGIDAVVVATGNDWRAVEAGAHAYAARSGRYAPLSQWRVGATGLLEGSLETPLAVGTVGGSQRVHRAARLALALLGGPTARELACVAASVGLASNLAALRALASEGIQRGHMSLHARSVAVAAGAHGGEVESVAATIAGSRDVTIDAARKALAAIRSRPRDEVQPVETSENSR